MSDNRLPIVSGWSAGDAHVHSRLSDGHADPAELALRAKRLGLGWICLADHQDSVCTEQVWPRYLEQVSAAADETGIEVVPAVEVGAKTGMQQSDMVWYGADRRAWLVTDRGIMPANGSLTHERLARAARDARAFASIAHPGEATGYKGLMQRLGLLPRKPWTHWEVGPVAAIEIMSNAVRPREDIVRRWLSMLDESLPSALDGAGFPVALGGTDAHFRRLRGRSLVWAKTGGTDGAPRRGVVESLAGGAASVSGLGDFASIEVAGHEQGEVVRATTGDILEVRIRIAPAQRRTCRGGILIGPDGLQLATFEPGEDRALTLEVDAPSPPGGYVLAAVDFTGPLGMKPSQTWTNPVFVDTRGSGDASAGCR